MRERPVAKDMDRDGFADVGLYVPAAGAGDSAAWFFFLSAGDTLFNRPNASFSPAPLGPDVFYNFGGNFPIPIVGNFDPPPTRPAFAPSALKLTQQTGANVLLTADVQLAGPGSSAGLDGHFTRL